MVSRRTAWWLFVPVLLVLVGYVLYPSLRTFALGLQLDTWADVFSSWRAVNVRALINSVVVSLGSVAGAGMLGTALAYFFFRYRMPGRRLLMAIAAFPLALPPLVGVLAFFFLYGESGILPRSLQALFNLSDVPFSFEGLWAVWLVHVYSLYVYFYLFVLAALRGVDRSLLEASADLGASSWMTFRRVVLPLLRPALVSAALLVFMISMASFTAPLLFADTDPFLTVQIYNYKRNGDLALSATISTLLTVICVVFLLLIEWTNRRQITGGAKGAAPPPLPVTGGWQRALAILGVVLLLLFLLLPIATVLLISFAQEGAWTYQILPASYTLSNYAALLADPDVFAPIWNSLQMAGLATVGNVVFGVAAALVVVKTTLRGRGLVRILAVLPFAIPGTVIAINLIVTFNTPTALAAGQILVGTFWILPLAYFIRMIPLVTRATSAALERYDDRLTEASADLGAPFRTTFWRVMLPIITPGIVAGTLLTFVTALGEFVSSILLYVYGNRPISVEVWAQLTREFNFGEAAAYSVFLMILIGLSTLAVRWMGVQDTSVSV
ncbi:MAG: ABC transporter permease subunit [Bacteroidetes bacterium]|jgi:iron(III) transport system permease protein|nr:ABC transporter permease subunit [Bacteroidota bacterium]